MARKQTHRLRMGGTKTTSKVEEKRLLKSIRALKDDPFKLVPACDRADNRCKFCPYPKIMRRLDIVQKTAQAGKDKKLAKLANGTDMAAAYAGALLVEQSGEVPRLAVAMMPLGKVAYAVRGSASKEKHIGVQHWNEPTWRTLAHRDMVRSKGLYLFDTSAGLFCSARQPRYPSKLMGQRLQSLKLGLKKQGSDWLCPHLDVGELEADPRPPGIYLNVTTAKGSAVAALCEACATKSKQNSLLSLLEVCATSKPTLLVKATVEGGLQPAAEAEVELAPLDAVTALGQYRKGGLSDSQLMGKLALAHIETLTDQGASGLILDTIYYGQDYAAAIEALKPGAVEKQALEAMLESQEKLIVLKDPTPARLLNELWSDSGRQALEAVAGNEVDSAHIEELAARFDGKNGLELVRQAAALREAATKLAGLPRYRNLPKVASIADTTARLARTEGAQAAQRYLDKLDSREPAAKATAWAGLLTLERAKGQEWRFTKEERDFGQALKDHADKLMIDEGDDYHLALQTLLAATGSTQQLQRLD